MIDICEMTEKELSPIATLWSAIKSGRLLVRRNGSISDTVSGEVMSQMSNNRIFCGIPNGVGEVLRYRDDNDNLPYIEERGSYDDTNSLVQGERLDDRGRLIYRGSFMDNFPDCDWGEMHRYEVQVFCMTPERYESAESHAVGEIRRGYLQNGEEIVTLAGKTVCINKYADGHKIGYMYFGGDGTLLAEWSEGNKQCITHIPGCPGYYTKINGHPLDIHLGGPDLNLEMIYRNQNGEEVTVYRGSFKSNLVMNGVAINLPKGCGHILANPAGWRKPSEDDKLPKWGDWRWLKVRGHYVWLPSTDQTEFYPDGNIKFDGEKYLHPDGNVKFDGKNYVSCQGTKIAVPSGVTVEQLDELFAQLQPFVPMADARKRTHMED
ncbi:MAG: hypothetical protein ACYCOU_18525 [Sulfobacillus sp.]